MVNIARLLTGLLYGGSVSVGYDGRVVRHRGKPGEAVKPLDPIDADLVGCLNLGACASLVNRLGLFALLTAISLVTESEATPDPEWLSRFRPCRRTNVRVGKKYRGHMEELGRCGLVKEVQLGDSLATSGYFCVDKNEEVARSIFNGKFMSKRCPAPDPVNLVDTRSPSRRRMLRGARISGSQCRKLPS